MKNFLYCLISIMFFLNSCIPLIILEKENQKEIDQTIEIIKNSHFEFNLDTTNFYKTHSIDQIFRKISNNNYKWNGILISGETIVYSTVQITYTNMQTYQAQKVYLQFYFHYDKQNKKIMLKTVKEFPTGREYSTKIGMDYVMKNLHYVYYNSEY